MIQPLYQQLETIIQQSIEDGTFKKGEKIPTELELSKLYQVSRITGRKPLEELTRGNYLVHKTVKGTFVSGEKFQRNLSSINNFPSPWKKASAKTIKSVIEDASAFL